MTSVISRESLAGMIIAPLLWALHFVLVYGLVAIGCAFGLDRVVMRIAVGILTVLALAGIVGVGVGNRQRWQAAKAEERESGEERPRPEHFLALNAVTLAGLFFIATVWVTMPVYLLPLCRLEP